MHKTADIVQQSNLGWENWRVLQIMVWTFGQVGLQSFGLQSFCAFCITSYQFSLGLLQMKVHVFLVPMAMIRNSICFTFQGHPIWKVLSPNECSHIIHYKCFILWVDLMIELTTKMFHAKLWCKSYKTVFD